MSCPTAAPAAASGLARHRRPGRRQRRANQRSTYRPVNRGDCNRSDEPLAEALVEVAAKNVSHVLDHWRIPPGERFADTDFGATPTIQDFTVNDSHYHRVGLINKNGFYYEFDRGELDDGPVWQTQLSTSHNNRSSSAFDGTTLYAAAEETYVDGARCEASLSAMNRSTATSNGASASTAGRAVASRSCRAFVAVAGGHVVNIVRASNGRSLRTFKDQDSIIWA
jgi:hypothetical protein